MIIKTAFPQPVALMQCVVNPLVQSLARASPIIMEILTKVADPSALLTPIVRRI